MGCVTKTITLQSFPTTLLLLTTCTAFIEIRMNTKTTNKHYDIQGLEMVRVIRLITLWKILRIDDIGGKPRLRDLLQLAVHHYAGRFAAIVTVKHEKRWLRSLVLIRE